jgi:hypothetical protein
MGEAHQNLRKVKIRTSYLRTEVPNSERLLWFQSVMQMPRRLETMRTRFVSRFRLEPNHICDREIKAIPLLLQVGIYFLVYLIHNFRMPLLCVQNNYVYVPACFIIYRFILLEKAAHVRLKVQLDAHEFICILYSSIFLFYMFRVLFAPILRSTNCRVQP